MIDWLRRDRRDPVVELAGSSVPVDIRRHPTAKRLVLRLAPDGGTVRVTLPRWCPTADALAFVEARRGWLEAQYAKVPPRRDPAKCRTLLYRGRDLPILWDEQAPRRVQLGDDAIRVGGPAETLNRRLQRWLDGEALTLFEGDARHYCARAKRRWGSCSSEGVLRMNWRLVMAPDGIRRSVVAHEVAHLVHFDHSPAFHALLARIFDGEIEEANGWLSRHGRTLYASFG